MQFTHFNNFLIVQALMIHLFKKCCCPFVGLILLGLYFQPAVSAGETVQIAVSKNPTALESKAIELLKNRLAERGYSVTESSTDQADIILRTVSDIPDEGFRIEKKGRQIELSAGDGRGMIYGVGRLLRGIPQTGPLEYFGEIGPSAPVMKTRGIYFATHFGNYHNVAPMKETKRYIEDMALFGYNILMVWFDMHHYTGIDDPNAEAMIERLRTVLAEARAVGMDGGLGVLANEAYSTSPRELRAVPFPSHYKVEICPSHPEGMKKILEDRAVVLDRFADVVQYAWIWPYDQGGCKCEKCSPWGSNGFMKCSEQVARLIRKKILGVKIIVSTWEFGYYFPDDIEWKGFYEQLSQNPDWLDIVLVEHHGNYPAFVLKNGRPGGFPVVNFPEVSMNNMTPWGGFGANTQIVRLEKVWKSARGLLDGGFPYSEGIYEDLNKFLCAQFYWAPTRTADSIVREYVRGYFSREKENAIVEAIDGLDRQMGHNVDWGQFAIASDALKHGANFSDLPVVYHLNMAKSEKMDRPFEILESVRASLPESVQKSWRWRLIYCRAGLDAELYRSGGKPTAKTEKYFKEIGELYFDEHVSAETIRYLRAPRLVR